ncbi:MAG: hypothetical protein V2A61_00060 [Calditrichota bacterium]
MAILFIIVFCSIVQAGEPEPHWPFQAPAPTGQFGAALCGEWDHRWMGSNEVTLQRAVFRLGVTTLKSASFWLESGTAKMNIGETDKVVNGDWGFAFGGGGVWTWMNFPYYDLLPFAYLRLTYFQTFLVDRSNSGGVITEAHSRYVWQEGGGVVGVERLVAGYPVFGGLALRTMFQDEYRSVRSSGQTTRRQYVYKTGLKPGAAVGVRIPLPQRWTIWVLGEAYIHAQKINLSIGQWGTP